MRQDTHKITIKSYSYDNTTIENKNSQEDMDTHGGLYVYIVCACKHTQTHARTHIHIKLSHTCMHAHFLGLLFYHHFGISAQKKCDKSDSNNSTDHNESNSVIWKAVIIITNTWSRGWSWVRTRLD